VCMSSSMEDFRGQPPIPVNGEKEQEES
jgi:hypothetical protein